MQQCWADLALWEKFLNKFPIKSLIELGTGYCGMSTYLLLQGIQRDIKFLTFDIRESSKLNLPLSKFLGLKDHFAKADVFADKDKVVYAINHTPKPLLLFCDNGDKPKEFKMFVPLLASGDYVAVHDWPQEIKEEDVDGFSIEPVMKEECEKWASTTRFWKIR
jgi:hypothetical protein